MLVEPGVGEPTGSTEKAYAQRKCAQAVFLWLCQTEDQAKAEHQPNSPDFQVLASLIPTNAHSFCTKPLQITKQITSKNKDQTNKNLKLYDGKFR